MIAPGTEAQSPPVSAQVVLVEHESIDATTSWVIRPVLRQALYRGGPKLRLDLAQVEFIDSTGLGMMVALQREAVEMGGELSLLNCAREVRRILEITGLEALFPAL